MPVGGKQTLPFGPFELDTHCGQLRRDGVGLRLQGQPVQILEILLEKRGQLVTRDELRQRLWSSDTFVDFDHSLNTAIKKLRQTLGDEADMPRYIETLPKRGYRFIGEVEREVPDDKTCNPQASPSLEDPTSKIVANLVDAVLEAQVVTDKRLLRWKWVGAAGAVVLLLAAVGSVVYSILEPEPQPRIVGTHALSKTGTPKLWIAKPIVDRGYIYFQEEGPLSPNGELVGSGTLRVPIGGGEVSAAPVTNGNVTDISRSGSFLLDLPDDQMKDQRDVWMQSPTDEVPRLIVKNGWQAIWSVDGRQIFFVRGKRAESQLYRANPDGTEVERLAPTEVYLGATPDA